MTTVQILLWCTLIFALAVFATRFLIHYLSKQGVVDIPNERSSHSRPTPSGGGIVIVSVLIVLMVVSIMAEDNNLSFVYLGVVLVIALMNLLDDTLHLPIFLRFIIQIIAACLIVYDTAPINHLPLPAPLDISLGIMGFPLSVIWIFGLMNIYNFLDGIDGYAAAKTVTTAIGLGIFIPEFQLICFGIAAATIGFLVFNWQPAKIFMGDTGAATLGFFFATVPFYFQEHPTEEGIFLVGILLWFFISDGVFTIFRRLFKGEKIWRAHRSHLYQRLVISGYFHQTVVLIIMSCNLVLITGYVMIHEHDRSHWYTLLLALVLFLGLIAWVTKAEKKNNV